ncbi:glucokinase [Campylobacterota bacterium]|nr:glucokinase [Campylobacterota bacterium]
MKLAFDIGGTTIRRACFEGSGIVDSGIVFNDTHSTKDGNLKEHLEALITESIGAYAIDFIGVSFAGQVTNGVIASAPNIDLGALAGSSFPLWIRDRFNLPAAINNDLKCAALAEAALRPECRSLFVVYIGTGIGGAFIEDGKLLSGAKNFAGEIGHIPFESAPFACGCGGASCLELSTSGSGVAKLCAHFGINAATLSDLVPLVGGDPNANYIYERFFRGVTHAVQTVAALFNPETIVLGGGVAVKNPVILNHAQHALKSAFKPASKANIELSTLGDNANLIGAAQLQNAAEF